jgi:hypothetical protein
MTGMFNFYAPVCAISNMSWLHFILLGGQGMPQAGSVLKVADETVGSDAAWRVPATDMAPNRLAAGEQRHKSQGSPAGGAF